MKRNYVKRVMGGWIVVVVMLLVMMIAVNVFAQYGKVSGKVIDAETKEPLNSVNVIITGEGFNSGDATDLDGRYRILGMPPGTYEMTFSMISYKTIEVSGVEVMADLTTILDQMMETSLIKGEVLYVEWEKPTIIPEKEEVCDPEPEMVSSEELEHTVIAAHMEVPITPGKNVIYCSTFQIAWNMLQDSIIKEDILLEGDPEIARMLNKQLSTTADISEECYVAMVGFLTQEFLDRINHALKEKFGENAPPMVEENINGMPPSILSYAYLFKNLCFEYDFEIIKKPINFVTVNDTVNLEAFGVPSHGYRDTIRSQISVVDYVDNNDFIIELLSTSPNDEVILAKIPPKKTLLETIEWVQERMSSGVSDKVKSDESVKIPKCDFKVKHSFIELLGKRFENSGWRGWFISEAMQWTRLRLNEKGVVLKSEARIVIAGKFSRHPTTRKPRRFIFDRPFLIYLKQKDGRYPYFAMWVDNGELLLKWEE